MRCSRVVWLLVVVALIGVAPSAPASSPEGSTARPSDSPALASTCAALRFPEYNPNVKYCGPAWLQESDYGGVVPRAPVPGFDFNPACYNHDACYSECCLTGSSQAECDGQFQQDMESICDDTRDALLGECSGWGAFGCGLDVAARYGLCYQMASTYRGAVSYLGAGRTIEAVPLAAVLAPLLIVLAGPAPLVVAAAIVAIARDPEVEVAAAYTCPCRCLDCPPDEPLGPPTCEVTASGAVVTQDITHYDKETHNVSGEGDVCECVSGEDVTTRSCPSGGTCAPDGRVCSSDICDPATCEREELVGRCEEWLSLHLWGGQFSLRRFVTERAVFACRAVDEYRSECAATTAETIGETVCLHGCTGDGLSCAGYPQHASLQVRVMEPADLDSSTLVPCRGCFIQLEGLEGTFQAYTSGGTGTEPAGTATFSSLRRGTYLVRYGCGPDTLGRHLPSDLIQVPWWSSPDSWVFAQDPHVSPYTAWPTVEIPVEGVVEVAVGSCEPSPTLILQPDGVDSWVDSWEFGDAAAGVVAGLTAMLGTPDDTHNEGLGCLEDPADPDACELLVRWEGFTAVFDHMGDGSFVGYSLDTRGAPGQVPASTPEGVGLGSTVAELELAYPAASWEPAFCSGILGYVWPPDYTGYRFGRSAANEVDLIYVGYVPMFC